MEALYSIETRKVLEHGFPYDGRQLTGTKDLIEFVKSISSLVDSDVEKMVSLYLDAQNSIVGVYTHTGTSDQAIVYPKEVIRHALLWSVSAIILVHNHPSGRVRPSDADIRLTNRICDAAKLLDIKVHDHMIVGFGGNVFSFRDEGLMP